MYHWRAGAHGQWSAGIEGHCFARWRVRSARPRFGKCSRRRSLGPRARTAPASMPEDVVSIRCPASMVETAALAGWTVVLTRPAQAARESLEALRAAGANAICLPVLDIEALDASPSPMPSTHRRNFCQRQRRDTRGLPRLRSAGLAIDAVFCCWRIHRRCAQSDGANKGRSALGFRQRAFAGIARITGCRVAEPSFWSKAMAARGRTLIEETLAPRGATVSVFGLLSLPRGGGERGLAAQWFELLGFGQCRVVVASGDCCKRCCAPCGSSNARITRQQPKFARSCFGIARPGFPASGSLPLSAKVGWLNSLSGHTAGPDVRMNQQ